jgi:rhodanese-related sulfurtransferase
MPSSLTPQDLRELLAKDPKPFLLDVRWPAEFDAGHIEGTINIPLPYLTLRSDELPQDQDIVVYCEHGMRSAKALHFLKDQGFTRVSHLEGGYAEFKTL